VDVSVSALLLQLVTWALVVAGWFLVDKKSNDRETRKEARSAIDDAKQQVMVICRTCVAYFSSNENALSDEIKSALQLMEVELERLKKFKDSNLLIRFVEFQDYCTGADFESASRVVHSPTSAVIQGILFTRNRLIQQLETHFREQYC
jgi:hypothetical protein